MEIPKEYDVRLVRAEDDIFDHEGKVIPTRSARGRIEAEYPLASPAEKWQLYQAATLIEKFGRKE